MGTIKATASEVYRDYDVDGVPATEVHDPEKRDIRTLFGIVDSAVYAAQAGLTIVADIAARDTFYATTANRTKLVYVNNNNGSSDDAANGVYEYVGAARLAEGYYQGLALAVQPLVDEAEAAAVVAEQAAADLRDGALEITRTINGADVTGDRFNIAGARNLPSITRRGLSNISRFSYPRVGVVGDSIMQANHSPFAARLLGKYARGMICVSHMLYPWFDFTAWTVDGAISSSEIDGLNKGKAGAQAGMGNNSTTGELGDFLNRLILARPEIIIISAGTNNIDIQTPAQAMAKITSMVDAARDSGAVVLVTSVRPLDATHGSYVPGQNAWIASLNSLLLAWAETAPVGIVYADVFAVYDNGSGDADPALLSDHVHPNYLGSLKEAREVWLPIFRQIVSPSIPDKPTETNLLPNPDFSGTGASGTGFSGALAPGWGYQRDGGAATVVGSKDGTDRQVLTVTSGGAANDTDGILLALFGGQSITENAWFQYWFDVEIDDWPGWRIVQAGFGAGTLMEQAVSNVDLFNGQGKTRMLLQSPPMKRIAALGNPIDLQLRVYSVSDAAGSGVLTINDAGMAIVADPRARYGMA